MPASGYWEKGHLMTRKRTVENIISNRIKYTAVPTHKKKFNQLQLRQVLISMFACFELKFANVLSTTNQNDDRSSFKNHLTIHVKATNLVSNFTTQRLFMTRTRNLEQNNH